MTENALSRLLTSRGRQGIRQGFNDWVDGNLRYYGGPHLYAAIAGSKPDELGAGQPARGGLLPALGEMSPGADMRDLMEGSAQVMQGQPLEGGALMGGAILGTMVPGSVGGYREAAEAIAEPTIKAYHGSPHDFDRFSTDKIGTGEGVTAYGHGLYFAENEKVAKAYRESLSPGSGATPKDVAARILEAVDGDYDKAAAEGNRRLNAWLKMPRENRDPSGYERFMEVQRLLISRAPVKGRMYEVGIKADPADLIDFDKPIAQQSAKVRGAIDKVLGDVQNPESTYLSAPDAKTAKALREAGVPGVKYLDQASRGEGKGTRNFVMFDDSLVQIMRKYGLLAPVAGGAAALSLSGQSSEAQAQEPNMADNIPTPPPGFQLRSQSTPAPPPQAAQSPGPGMMDVSAVPPPPPGFELRPRSPMQAPQPSPQSSLSPVQHMARGMANFGEQIGAAWQGTNPQVRSTGTGEHVRPLVGDFIETDTGPAAKTADGQWIPVDPSRHVIMRDPQDDVVRVFERTEDSDERIAALGRMVSLGATSTAPIRALNAPQAPGMTGQLTRDFQATGVNPTIAAVNQGRVPKMIQQGMANNPITAGPVSRAAETSLDQTADATRGLAQQYGTATTPFEAGGALRRGAEAFKSRFLDKADELYSAVGRSFAPDETVAVPRSLEALGAPSQRFHNAELGQQFVDPRLANWAEIIERSGGSLSWNDLRAFRSEVGRMLAKPAIISDVDRAQLERVYGALSDDIMTIAQAKGPAAANAVQRANKYYRAGIQRINGALKELLQPGTEEGAYALLFKVGQEKGAGASARRISQLRHSMPDEEWGDVASTVLMELGRAPAGARSAVGGSNFSVGSFMTNYEKLSDAAKAALFSGGDRTQLRQQLDRLVRVISAQKEVDRLANTSNTALSLSTFALGSAAWAAPIETITGWLVGNMGARLLMNPRFVGWLNATPQGGGATQAAWLKHLASLRQIGLQNPELMPGTEALLQRLPNPALGGQPQGGQPGRGGGGPAQRPFDPESGGYDLSRAKASGMTPAGPEAGENEGHMGSVAHTTPDERGRFGLPEESYILLKGRDHETWRLAVEGEEARGFKVVKLGNRYYSVPRGWKGGQ